MWIFGQLKVWSICGNYFLFFFDNIFLQFDGIKDKDVLCFFGWKISKEFKLVCLYLNLLEFEIGVY